jgi:hypothetical protein
MKQNDAERLRKYEGSLVKLFCTDGEILEAKISWVNSNHRDVIYDLISSTTPEKYRRGQACAYVIKWDDILHFKEIPK